MTDKKLKVTFAPGAIEEMERTLTPEDMQAIMDAIKAMIDDGTFISKARPVDMDELKQTDPDLYQKIVKSIPDCSIFSINSPELSTQN